MIDDWRGCYRKGWNGTLVPEAFAILRPGAHAVWIVKAFVKDKQIVPFPDQWRQLCEAVGFVTVHEHHAWLVEEKGNATVLFNNGDLNTGDVVHVVGTKKKRVRSAKTERKSFFRRLAEKKGSPRIDYETVFCMERP